MRRGRNGLDITKVTLAGALACAGMAVAARGIAARRVERGVLPVGVLVLVGIFWHIRGLPVGVLEVDDGVHVGGHGEGEVGER